MVTFSLDVFAQPMGSPWAADLSGLFEAVGIRIGLALVLTPVIGFKGILRCAGFVADAALCRRRFPWLPF